MVWKWSLFVGFGALNQKRGLGHEAEETRRVAEVTGIEAGEAED